MHLVFYKYHGTGNDFIIIDNRDNKVALSIAQIKKLCERRFGIGADGLMLLNYREGYDFEMKYYNSDGNEGSMCGNGGRCVVKFAHYLGIHKSNYFFLATDGEHEAFIEENSWIDLKMKDVNGIKKHYLDFVLHTGSPHYIKQITDVATYDVVNMGRGIRYSKEFEKDGINVNFVEVNDKEIFVRTYERGVEDETLSCGTGVTAAALVFANNDNGLNYIEVKTPGGALAVRFDKLENNNFKNIWLCGPAEFVFKGEINVL